MTPILLTHAKLVYARGYIVAFIFKLSHFIVPNNDACGAPFIDNVTRGVPVCKIDNEELLIKNKRYYTFIHVFKNKSVKLGTDARYK